MNTYTVEWGRLLSIPVMVGCLGMLLAGLGMWQKQWMFCLVGYLGIGYMICRYVQCRMYRDDYISVAETYLIVHNRNATRIIHAADIREIEYGKVLRIKCADGWIDMSHCKSSSVLQYELVHFAVENNIYVHAFGYVRMQRGKNYRTKKSRQRIC